MEREDQPYPIPIDLHFEYMKQIVVYTTLLVSVFLIACTNRPANAQADGEPVFAVSAAQGDDEITLQTEDNTTVIDIHSPTGIGSAVFRLEAGRLPAQIVVQLHLRGLEEVRLVAEEVTVVASVSGEQVQSQRKISGNSEQALGSFDALWLNIQIVAESATLPLDAGYFEIHVPEELLERSGGRFEIHWIDFFR